MAEGVYKDLNNQEYWLKRSEARVSAHWKNLENIEKSLVKNYRMVNEEIKAKLAQLYADYAVDNTLSYADAIKQLNQFEIGIYRQQIQSAIANAGDNKELIEKLERLLPTNQVTRLQATVNQIEARLIELGYTEQITTEDWLAETYRENYYQTIFEVQQGIGLGFSFNRIDERAVKTAISYPWSGDQFSNRVWDNKSKLVKNLRQTITQGLIKGEGYRKTARNMADKMDSSYKDSLRLIRTETASVMSTSSAEGWGESGIVRQYIIIGTLDSRTSKICQHQDTKVYDLKDRKIGVNAEPFHPSCRSTSSVYFGEEFQAGMQRIARGADGKNYKVPATMNYKEWKSKYVDGETA